MSTPETPSSNLPDHHREDAWRKPPPSGDSAAPTELVVQLQALRDFQNDLWDYVQGLIRAGDSYGRCERLFDFLDAKREEAESELYWQGASKIIREMSSLGRTLPKNLIAIFNSDEEAANLKLVTGFDTALEAANSYVRTARNPFEGGTDRPKSAYNLLASVESMQDASSQLADLCRGRAQDLSEQAKQCVVGILGFFNQISAGPAYAPMQKPPPVAAARSKTLDERSAEHEAPLTRVEGRRDEAPPLRQDRPSPDQRSEPEVSAHSTDWRKGG